MEIFWEQFMKAVMWVFGKTGVAIGMGIQKLGLGLFRLTAERRRKPPASTESKAEDRKRVMECEEVAEHFLVTQGHIARRLMSREELVKKIEGGITSDQLYQELAKRVEATPGVILGENGLRADALPVKVPDFLRDRHMYIIGRSGSGKTNLLRTIIYQDLEQDNGIGVLAPEQEFLTEEILPYIPDHRMDDVVYVDPADIEYPVSFNPLHLEEGENIDLRVDETFTAFKRFMGETGARMDEILRQSLYALIDRPGSTLLDMESLLSRENMSFRDEIIRTSNDPQTVRFFAETYPSYPKDAHLPITTRISRLIRPKVVRSLLCQPGHSFNFRDAMDEGKILLFNLSDGLLGTQTSQLLGQLIVSKLQMAAMSRVNISAKARRPFYLYLDEFQAFVGVNEEAYTTLLERARKYQLGLILAHQQTGQLTHGLLKQILGNVSTIISFSVSSDDAARIAGELTVSMGMETEHIPPDQLTVLKIGEAWGRIGSTVCFIKTRLADEKPDFARAKEIIERSRRSYGSSPLDYLEAPRLKPKEEEPIIDPSKVF